MSDTKHTPLPWKAVEVDGYYDIHHLPDDDHLSEVVGSEGISKKEDADYIVHTPNHYPALLAALDNMIKWAHRSIELEVSGSMKLAAEMQVKAACEALATARA